MSLRKCGEGGNPELDAQQLPEDVVLTQRLGEIPSSMWSSPSFRWAVSRSGSAATAVMPASSAAVTVAQVLQRVQLDLPEPLAHAGQPPHGRTEVGGRPDVSAAGPQLGRGGAAAHRLGADVQVGREPLAGRAHVQRAAVVAQLEAAKQSQVKAGQVPA
jgi:hypothetical protein